MRHLRVAFDESFWQMANEWAHNNEPETDEGFEEPPCLQDLIDLDLSQSAVDFFFPDADFVEENNSQDVGPVDLFCDEILDSPDDQPLEESHFASPPLDYPEVPGVNCAACSFHRENTGHDDAVCGLCYMRKTAFAVYGRWLTFAQPFIFVFIFFFCRLYAYDFFYFRTSFPSNARGE